MTKLRSPTCFIFIPKTEVSLYGRATVRLGGISSIMIINSGVVRVVRGGRPAPGPRLMGAPPGALALI